MNFKWNAKELKQEMNDVKPVKHGMVLVLVLHHGQTRNAANGNTEKKQQATNGWESKGNETVEMLLRQVDVLGLSDKVKKTIRGVPQTNEKKELLQEISDHNQKQYMDKSNHSNEF